MAAPTSSWFWKRFAEKCLIGIRQRNVISKIARQYHRHIYVISQKCNPTSFLSGVAVLSVFGLTWKKGKAEETETVHQLSPEEELIKEADELYTKNEMLKLYDLLTPHADSNNADIVWRLARATCDKAKLTQDKTMKKKLIYEAFDLAKKAMSLDENNFACHKWYSILLDYKGEYEGTKFRISNSYEVKKHFVRAMELNPKDATSIHSVGVWCFAFADLPWYQHKLAAALFATPPTSTYEEALYYFEKAEEAEPNFYSMNLLMLGKTHLRLGNKEKAHTYLTRALNYPVKTPDDEQAHREAIDLLKKTGL